MMDSGLIRILKVIAATQTLYQYQSMLLKVKRPLFWKIWQSWAPIISQDKMYMAGKIS